MRKSRNTVIGFAAGIAAGVSYGLNPLFGKPLLDSGVSVLTMLFFRYFISTFILGVWMFARKEQFRIHRKETAVLILLGLLFSCSSLFLFESYRFIPSGLATTIVYLYPVFVALTMVFLKSYPTWQVWVSIAATFVGVLILCKPSDGVSLNWTGMSLAALSALSYAFYLVIVNRSKTIKNVSEHAITFYALTTGTLLFLLYGFNERDTFLTGIDTSMDIFNLFGLAIFPTMVSLLALAVSTRMIGPTKNSVLGVFEPVTAILIGTLAFSEPATPNIIIGIIICISAILFMVLSEKRN